LGVSIRTMTLEKFEPEKKPSKLPTGIVSSSSMAKDPTNFPSPKRTTGNYNEALMNHHSSSGGKHSSSSPRPTPSKKSNLRNTPKKIWTKLFCSSSAQKQDNSALDIFPSTSLEDHYEQGLQSSSSENQADHSPGDATETTGESNFTGNQRNMNLRTPPRPSRKLTINDGDKHHHPEEETDENRNTENRGLEDPTRTPLPESPVARSLQTSKVQEILTTSPDPMEDIFLPESGSSYSEASPPLASPHNPQGVNMYSRDSDSDSTPSYVMKMQGLAIPTPAQKYLAEQQHVGNPQKVLFPHPLPTMKESPAATNSVVLIDEEDDDAFLPDDFKSVACTYTWEQVQTHVQQAQEESVEQLQQQHEERLKEFQDEAETMLQAHGVQWKAESDAEYQRMDALLKEEKCKTEQQDLELINKVQMMNDLQRKLEASQVEKEAQLQTISKRDVTIKDLEDEGNKTAKAMYKAEMEKEIRHLRQQVKSQSLPKSEDTDEWTQKLETARKEKLDADQKVESMQQELTKLQQRLQTVLQDGDASSVIDSKHQEELKTMQASKDEATQQIHGLHEQLLEMRQQHDSPMEELILLKSEKAAAERTICDLQEQLDSVRSRRGETSNAPLEEARLEISSLQKQMEMFTRLEAVAGKDVEEQLSTSQAEIESLQAKLTNVTSYKEEEEALRLEQLSRIEGERNEAKARLKTLKEQFEAVKSQAATRSNEEERLAKDLESLQEQLEEMRLKHALELVAAKEEAEEQLQSLDKDHGEWDARLQKAHADRDALESQFQEMRQKHADELIEAREEVRQEMEEEIGSLKDQLEKMRIASDTERDELFNTTAAERDELQKQLDEGQEAHLLEFAAQKKAASEHLERQLQAGQDRFDKLWAEFEDEKTELYLNLTKEADDLRAQIEAMKAKFDERLDLVKAQSKDASIKEIEELHNQIERVRLEFEKEKIEIIETSAREHDQLQKELTNLQHEEVQLLRAQLDKSHHKYEMEKFEVLESSEKECDDLRVKLVEMKQRYEQKLEQANEGGQEEAAKEIAGLKAQLEMLREENEMRSSDSANKALEDRKKLELYIHEMQGKREEDLEDAKAEFDALQKKYDSVDVEKVGLLRRIEELAARLELLEATQEAELESAKVQAKKGMEEELKSLEDYIENMKAGDSELLQKITAMEAQTVADRKEYESQVREVRAEHGKEIEEMLSQLDLVEAEADQRYARTEKVVIAKDAVISALGSQLAEAQTRLNTFTERHDSMSRELEATHEEAQYAASEIEKKNQAIQRMKVAHEQALENELVLREKTCEDAREEMIARAEQQFDQANATYKKLKQEYDTAVVKLSGLEKDLKAAKKEVHEAKKKQESREFDLADKLAQAKACKYTSR
jgi:chromosome segregation ATPase